MIAPMVLCALRMFEGKLEELDGDAMPMPLLLSGIPVPHPVQLTIS